MADWNKPSSADAYNNVGGVLDSLAQKDLDAARAFDDASTAPTNTPTGAMRLSTNERKFKWWDGSAWIEKITEFAINIGGYAAKLQTKRKINVTGALTSAGADFDGTADINIDVTDVDLDKVGKAGTAAKANVGTASGQLVPAEQVVFGQAGSGTINVFPADGGIGADAITKSGFYRPNGDKGYALLTHTQHNDAGSPNAFQFGTDIYGSTRFFARGQGAGVWTPNVEFWTTGNFDPASKADANKYLPLSGGTLTGQLVSGAPASGAAFWDTVDRGGSFYNWTNLSPSIQVDAADFSKAYMAVRWTRWNGRNLAAISAYEGGSASSEPAICFQVNGGGNPTWRFGRGNITRGDGGSVWGSWNFDPNAKANSGAQCQWNTGVVEFGGVSTTVATTLDVPAPYVMCGLRSYDSGGLWLGVRGVVLRNQ